MLNFIENFLFKIDLKIPNKVGTNKKADYNWIRGSNGQDTNKAVRVLLLGGRANHGSEAGSGCFLSLWARSASYAYVGFFYIIPKTNKYKTNINIILGSITLPLGKR